MGERSMFWDGTLIGDAAAEAPYDSAEYAAALRNLMGAARADYGVIDGSGDGTNLPLQVLASSPVSKVVHLQIGAALVNGRLYLNDADLPLTVQDNASGQPRVDMLVIRRDTVAQTARAVLKQGAPAASPVPPALQQDSTTWEIPVATIAVANGFASINQYDIRAVANVLNGNGQAYYDDVLNDTGLRLETGNLVYWSTTTAKAVRGSGVVDNDSSLAGVWVGSTPAGARGRVQCRGVGWVLVDQNLSVAGNIFDGLVGDGLEAVYAKLQFYQVAFGVGRLLEMVPTAVSGSRLALALIDVRSHPAEYALFGETYQGSTPGTFTSGSWRRRNIGSLTSPLPRGITFDGGNFRIQVANDAPVRLEFAAPAHQVNNHSTRLFDAANAVLIAEGSPENAPSGTGIQTWSRGEVQGVRNSGTPMAIQLDHQCQTTRGNDGIGLPNNAWQTTAITYATVKVWRGWS